MAEMKRLHDALAAKGVEFSDVIKMGRTQLQDAVPMTMEQEFRAFATLLKEDFKLIEQMRQLLLEVNLGATAIGTGVKNCPDSCFNPVVKSNSKKSERYCCFCV